MGTLDDSEWVRGLTAFEAGRYSETFEILRPLANAGNVKSQACLGSIVRLSMHRFPDLAAVKEWFDTASPDQLADFDAKYGQADRELAEVWLQSASDGGDGGASHNLAMMFVTGIGEEGWEDRRRKVLALLAKSREQGFHCFEDGNPPGEAYLQFMERDAALHERYTARHPDEA
jgi:hypothetical protein